MDKLTHIDLFSGIGGFSLAARRNGIETSVFCEQNQFCQKVLNKNFQGVPIIDDIRDFDGSKWAGAFILTGGFPCQPFSCAGKRRGKEDDRYLWPEMLRVVSEAKPRWVIGENVAGFIGMGLDDCLSDLENQGYETQAFVIPACAVNAPHRRDRVWIVANSANLNEQRGIGTGNHSWRSEVPFGNENCHTADSGCFIQTEQEQQAAGSKQYHCHASHSSSQRLQGGQWPPAHGEGQAAHGSVTQRNSAWDESWIDVAFRTCLRTLDDGLSGGLVRPKGWRVNALKAAGNSIVPQVAYQIIKSILEVEKSL